jgi:hypothetical protein
MTTKQMYSKLCQYFGIAWMDEFWDLQNKGYSEDGAIVKCYNSYFITDGRK